MFRKKFSLNIVHTCRYSVVSDTGEEKDGKVELNQKDSALPTGLALTRFHCLLMFRDK